MKNFNTVKNNLSTRDCLELANLLGHRCSLKTKAHLVTRLTYDSTRLPSYGIFERLVFENFEWSYCAGMDYRAEIRTIRNLILKGVY